MSSNLTVKISQRAKHLAEEKSAREGFASVDDYVDSLILDDNLGDILDQPWLREMIEEGLKSGNAGELTRDRLRQLVDEGIALAENDKR